MYRPHSMAKTEKEGEDRPGHGIYDMLCPNKMEGKKYVSGSDGSAHLDRQVAAAAWMITTGPDHYVSATFLMSGTNKVTAYRAELEGIYRTLVHTDQLGLTMGELEHWCDNELAVRRSNESPSRPKHMIAPEADIILAIHHAKRKLGFPALVRHVRGHQDTRRNRGVAPEEVSPQGWDDDDGEGTGTGLRRYLRDTFGIRKRKRQVYEDPLSAQSEEERTRAEARGIVYKRRPREKKDQRQDVEGGRGPRGQGRRTGRNGDQS